VAVTIVILLLIAAPPILALGASIACTSRGPIRAAQLSRQCPVHQLV